MGGRRRKDHRIQAGTNCSRKRKQKSNKTKRSLVVTFQVLHPRCLHFLRDRLRLKHRNINLGSSGTLRVSKKGSQSSINSRDSSDGSKFEDCNEDSELREAEKPSKRGGILSWFGF